MSYPYLARHVLAPALDIARGAHTMRCLAELEQSQWWPADRLLELQSERLRRLIHYAYSHVSFYRQTMAEHGLAPSDIQDASDLFRLPILTKTAVRTQLPRLISDTCDPSNLLRGTTSGSTGTPLVFYSTRHDQIDRGYARTVRAFQWAGLEIGDRFAYVGRLRNQPRLRDRVVQRASNEAKRVMHVDPDQLEETRLARTVERLRRGRLHGMSGYPMSLAVIAEFIRRESVQGPTLRSIVTGGAQLPPTVRRLLTEVFGTEPNSKYATTEVFDIASECEAHEGLHIQAEDVIAEVVDDDGHPLPRGAEGRIIVTNLHNYGMPFIRYDIGDIGSLSAGTCACGRALPRFADISGRSNGYLITPTGRRVSPGGMHFERLADLTVLQYQMVQDDIDTVILRLVPFTGLSNAQQQDLTVAARRLFAEDLHEIPHFTVELTPHIEPGPSGKHTFVFSRVASAIEGQGG
ncbi:MAG: phenylacetate--CoA ligase family protein [Dehalococcoidia bacterium]|nr:phenylacetate--CoA ligase family protein [Dehalococcoidia bacterium]